MSGVAGLTAALANPLLDHILLEAGTYPLISPLLIERSVVLEAAQPGTVVLDGLGVSRVLSIGLLGLSLAVELIGLNITRGRSIIASVSQTKLSIAPMNKLQVFTLFLLAGWRRLHRRRRSHFHQLQHLREHCRLGESPPPKSPPRNMSIAPMDSC